MGPAELAIVSFLGGNFQRKGLRVGGCIRSVCSYRDRIVSRLGLRWFVCVSSAASGNNYCREGRRDGECVHEFRTNMTTLLSISNLKNSEDPANNEHKDVERCKLRGRSHLSGN